MSSPALRFVVLRHEGVAEPHFDLMFETSPESELLTWRAPSWPLQPGMILTELGSHRRAYLSYEGPVSGNRGNVRRVAAGRYALRAHRPDLFEIEVDEFLIRLSKQASDSWRCDVVEQIRA
jgi:hypothetical protein